MLVSHLYKFIYTKTAKTAGTSVELFFEPFCVDPSAPKTKKMHHRGSERVTDAGIIGFRGGQPPPDCVWWHHMSAAEIKRLLGEEIWNSYFKFCAVRNPYDKAISLFYFLRNRGRIKSKRRAPDSEQFEQWLLQGNLWLDRVRYVIDGRFALDDVIKYEQLEADVARISQRLRLPILGSSLPKLKVGSRPASATITQMYTEKSADVVRRRYAFEFEQFGYDPDIAHYSK
jgi:hypothetical protein